MKKVYPILLLILLCSSLFAPAKSEVMDNYHIYSKTAAPIKIHYPDWFKKSFYDLEEDLNEAREAGKRGIILIFTQENCSHCQALIKATFNNPGVNKRIRRHFDVIGIEIFSDLEVTDIDGSTAPIRAFAEKWRARLTPTILFYGVEKTPLLRIMGFYPPEKFHQVLDYIEDGQYAKVKLGQYLRYRKSQEKMAHDKFDRGIVKDPILFQRPPVDLRPARNTLKRPTLALFESNNCKPCIRFHERVLNDREVRESIAQFHAVQLDSSDNVSQVITPDGRTITPKQWSQQLQLNYDVSVVFFDESGKEVFRNDAEVASNRMLFTMKYVLAGAYKKEHQLNRWRRQTMLKQVANTK